MYNTCHRFNNLIRKDISVTNLRNLIKTEKHSIIIAVITKNCEINITTNATWQESISIYFSLCLIEIYLNISTAQAHCAICHTVEYLTNVINTPSEHTQRNTFCISYVRIFRISMACRCLNYTHKLPCVKCFNNSWFVFALIEYLHPKHIVHMFWLKALGISRDLFFVYNSSDL
jgi:hypothetical protein